MICVHAKFYRTHNTHVNVFISILIQSVFNLLRRILNGKQKSRKN